MDDAEALEEAERGDSRIKIEAGRKASAEGEGDGLQGIHETSSLANGQGAGIEVLQAANNAAFRMTNIEGKRPGGIKPPLQDSITTICRIWRVRRTTCRSL